MKKKFINLNILLCLSLFAKVISIGKRPKASFKLGNPHLSLNRTQKDFRLANIFEKRDYSQGAQEEAAKLITAGANPNLIVNYNSKNMSILNFIATTGEFKDLTNLLIKYGADINAKDDSSNTPIMNALLHDKEEVAIALLAHKSAIDINAVNNKQQTALMLATIIDKPEVVKFLLQELDTTPEELGIEDIGTREITAYNQPINTREVVIAKNINAQDEKGNTALIWAVKFNNDAIAGLLIDSYRVDVNIKDNLGKTALMYAAQNGNKKIVESLFMRDDLESCAKDHQNITAEEFALNNRALSKPVP